MAGVVLNADIFHLFCIGLNIFVVILSIVALVIIFIIAVVIIFIMVVVIIFIIAVVVIIFSQRC
jgi:hypothetical protein